MYLKTVKLYAVFFLKRCCSFEHSCGEYKVSQAVAPLPLLRWLVGLIWARLWVPVNRLKSWTPLRPHWGGDDQHGGCAAGTHRGDWWWGFYGIITELIQNGFYIIESLTVLYFLVWTLEVAFLFVVLKNQQLFYLALILVLIYLFNYYSVFYFDFNTMHHQMSSSSIRALYDNRREIMYIKSKM